jgi:hypothetical protein
MCDFVTQKLYQTYKLITEKTDKYCLIVDWPSKGYFFLVGQSDQRKLLPASRKRV